MKRTLNNRLSYRVSVVIPAYNLEGYIGRAIESVLAQTRPADEIIVVDDGSTDGTVEIVKKYGSAVRYIYQENAGASAARNTGIKAAKNEWIAFLDGDDEWLEGNLERQMGLLERNEELVWTAGNFIICYCREGRRQDKLDPDRGLRLLEGKEYFPEYFQAFMQSATGWTGTMVIKKSVLEEADLFRVGQLGANDLDMWWRIAYRRPVIGYNVEPLAVYHLQVSDSITKRFCRPEILSNLIERHLKLAEEYGRSEAFRPCAEHVLRYWIHKYILDERIFGVRDMIVRFDDLLPFFYRAILWLLTVSPRATLSAMPVLRRINRLLRLPI
ncbi:MAG: glycosyltransferase family 2 protein [Sedimentisphaerales bacterium]|nr:glycosyltransferase family 2 protein [Sedimentisphaerales bacterium]